MPFLDDFLRGQFLDNQLEHYHKDIKFKLNNWKYTMMGIWYGHHEAKQAIQEYMYRQIRRTKHFTINR